MNWNDIINNLDKNGEVSLLNFYDGNLAGKKYILNNENFEYAKNSINKIKSKTQMLYLNSDGENLFNNLDIVNKNNIDNLMKFSLKEDLIEGKIYCNNFYSIERLVSDFNLVILGAGHVGKALYDYAVEMNFNIHILDDRKEFLNNERFPLANIYLGDYKENIKKIENLKNTFFVIVTPGHGLDKLCLNELLQFDYRYLGMIGSKFKVSGIIKEFKNKYKDDKNILLKLDNLCAPIGLDIGAQTPSEIAISILSQIILFKNKNTSFQLSKSFCNKFKELRDRHEDFVIVSIVHTKGSAPRSVGTRMIVSKNEIFETIGGGAIELEAIRIAKDLLTEKNHINSFVRTFELTNTQGAKLGMNCGGMQTILFEKMEM